MALSRVYIIRVSASALQFLGLLLTVWRIYIRLKIRRFWWEDAWAVILLFIGLLCIIVQWLFLSTNGLTSVINSWIYSVGFTSMITSVHMSILFSIIRIAQGSPRLLKFTYACAAFEAVCWIILIVEKVVQCGSNPNWHHSIIKSGKPFCKVKPHISIFQFTTDCILISILVVLPLRMLWRVKLPRRQRRMILSIFASSILLAFGALFHTIGQMLDIFLVMVLGINVEITLALIVCNLLVVVTHLYRFLYRGRDNADTTREDSTTSCDDDFTTPLTRSAQPQTAFSLTTVDLDISTSDCQTSRRTRGQESRSQAATDGPM